jgi:hypothetical protein
MKYRQPTTAIQGVAFWGALHADDGNVYTYRKGKEPLEERELYVPLIFADAFPGMSEAQCTTLRNMHAGILTELAAEFVGAKLSRPLPLKSEPREALLASGHDTMRIALLHQHAAAGDQESLRALLNIGVLSAECLQDLMDTKPDAFKGTAEDMENFPVLATLATDWSHRAHERLRCINFGEQAKHATFTAKGLRATARDDKPSVARKWALLCFQILDQNRAMMQHVGDRLDPFIAFLNRQYPRMRWIKPPAWALACRDLPRLERNKASQAKWGKVLADMLDAEHPEFYQAEEWRDTWTRREFQRMGGKVLPSTTPEDMERFFKKCGGLLRSRCLSDIKAELIRIAE